MFDSHVLYSPFIYLVWHELVEMKWTGILLSRHWFGVQQYYMWHYTFKRASVSKQSSRSIPCRQKSEVLIWAIGQYSNNYVFLLNHFCDIFSVYLRFTNVIARTGSTSMVDDTQKQMLNYLISNEVASMNQSISFYSYLEHAICTLTRGLH